MTVLRVGDVIAGKFRIERVLGEGGMGYVVAARHLQLGQLVALKFMREEVLTAEYKSRFLREARNTVRLKSKHVSRVLDVGTLEGGAPYIVMEYLEGTDLSNLLRERGALGVQEACEYVIQACEAISEAHEHGIVHRDLKPANLFLTRGPGGESVVKVLDFGVSKVLDLGSDEDTSPGGRPRSRVPDSVVTKVSDLLGSPNYMAPEQIMSASDADARSDVWSLGVILYRLLSGKPPFVAASLGELIQSIVHGATPNLRDVRPDIPQGLEHVIAGCLERDRQRRIGDVATLAQMLAPYAGPTAAPSLERIAILGPALVTLPPPVHPPPATHPSASNGQGAWTSMPPGATFEPARPPSAALGSALWVGLFLLVVGGAFFAVIKMTDTTSTRGDRDPLPPAAASPLPVPVVVAEPAPSAPARPPPTTAPAPAASVTAAVTSSPASTPAPKPRTAPRAKGKRSTVGSSGEIPDTRE